MADAIAVLNAGSSSLKFSVFALQGEGTTLVVRGQAEGLFTSPRFVGSARASGANVPSIGTTSFTANFDVSPELVRASDIVATITPASDAGAGGAADVRGHQATHPEVRVDEVVVAPPVSQPGDHPVAERRHVR